MVPFLKYSKTLSRALYRSEGFQGCSALECKRVKQPLVCRHCLTRKGVVFSPLFSHLVTGEQGHPHQEATAGLLPVTASFVYSECSRFLPGTTILPCGRDVRSTPPRRLQASGPFRRPDVDPTPLPYQAHCPKFSVFFVIFSHTRREGDFYELLGHGRRTVLGFRVPSLPYSGGKNSRLRKHV